MEELNYKHDMRIDESALDIEWLEQAELMMKYVRHAAEMERIRDKKKEELEYTEAKLDKEIRENPDSFGLTKSTDTVVNNTIKRQDEYQRLADELVQARYDARVARGAVDAMRDRKEALQELDRLHALQYFAGPSSPRDLSWERKKREDEQDKNVVQGTAKSKRRRRNE